MVRAAEAGVIQKHGIPEPRRNADLVLILAGMLALPCPASESPPSLPRSTAVEITDDNLTGLTTPPVIEGRVPGKPANEPYSYQAVLEAVVTDNCGVLADNISIDVTDTTGGGSLGAPATRITQIGPRTVEVSVSVGVFGATGSPAEIQFSLSAENNCGLSGTRLFPAALGSAG
jgi:hypothetical protein